MPSIDRIMPKPSNSPLRSNPFQAYRNPTTGEWLVIENATENEQNPRERPSLIKLQGTEIHCGDRDRINNKAKSIVPTLSQYR